MSEVDVLNNEATGHSAVPQSTLGLVSVALVLPVLSGVLLFFVTSIPIAVGISVVTVVATAALVAIDAHRLGRMDLKGSVRESAGVLFLGMCLFWIIVYPLAFFRRRSFGGPNLGVIAVGVALFFTGGPFVRSWLIPRPLPTCSSAEVVRLLEQVIHGMPVGAMTKSIDGHRELSFDPDASVRHGECVIHTETGDIPVHFMVEWQDRDKGLYQVRLPLPDLPTCASAQVVQALEQVIRSLPVGATTKSIDGHRELRFDRDANARHGVCIAHTETGDIPVHFIVEWQDREKGLFQVRIVATPE